MKVFLALAVLALCLTLCRATPLLAVDSAQDDLKAKEEFGKDALGLWDMDSTDELTEGIPDTDKDAERFMETHHTPEVVEAQTGSGPEVEADTVSSKEETVGAETTPTSEPYTTFHTPGTTTKIPPLNTKGKLIDPVQDSTPVLTMDVPNPNNVAPEVIASSSNSPHTKDVTHTNIAGVVDPLEDAEEPMDTTEEEEELGEEKAETEALDKEEELREQEEHAKQEAAHETEAQVQAEHEDVLNIASQITDQIQKDIDTVLKPHVKEETLEEQKEAEEEKEIEEEEEKEEKGLKGGAKAVLTKLLSKLD